MLKSICLIFSVEHLIITTSLFPFPYFEGVIVWIIYYGIIYYQTFQLSYSETRVFMLKWTGIMYKRKMDEVPENDGFVGDKEDDEVDIDAEFEEE